MLFPGEDHTLHGLMMLYNTIRGTDRLTFVLGSKDMAFAVISTNHIY